MAGKELRESRPSNQGIVVLGIYHHGGKFEGAPSKDAVISPGETIMVYGTEESVEGLVKRNPNPAEVLDKLDERAKKVD